MNFIFLSSPFCQTIFLDILTEIYNWLKANPNEVLTLLFTNGDFLSVKELIEPVYTASRLPEIALNVTNNTLLSRYESPTYGELLDEGVQAIIITDYYVPYFTLDVAVPFIIYEFCIVSRELFCFKPLTTISPRSPKIRTP